MDKMNGIEVPWHLIADYENRFEEQLSVPIGYLGS
jgi:hypothetical protein